MAERSHPTQRDTPYLDAIAAYAARNPARLHIPGHKGGPGADPGLVEVIGAAAVAHDIPGLTWGIDIGPKPTPFEQAQRLAAEAWGAARTWFLVSGASQGNLAAGLALAHYGDEVVLQRNGHSSTIDSLVLSGLRPAFVAPEIDPELGIAHVITSESLERAISSDADSELPLGVAVIPGFSAWNSGSSVMLIGLWASAVSSSCMKSCEGYDSVSSLASSRGVSLSVV